MLLRMGIRNFALIEQLHMEFQDGITVITGETGAGKSILIDALSILLGDRASAEYIRHEKDSFVIEGLFDISQMKTLKAFLDSKNIIYDNDELFLSRSFNRAGKTTILINNQAIPLKLLSQIGIYLADIHGQYSNQRLLDVSDHHLYLDQYTTKSKWAFKAYQSAYEDYRCVKEQLEDLISSLAERERQFDMLRFQIDEIESAHIVPNEDELIGEELKRFDNFERLHDVVRSSYDALYDSSTPILDVLNSIRVELKNSSHLDSQLSPISDLVDSSYFQLEEAAHSLSTYMDSISYDEERYDFCRQRDSLLYTLKKKYGPTLTDVISFNLQAQEKLSVLESTTFDKDHLESELARLEGIAYEALDYLREERHKNKVSILTVLHEKIAALGLEKALLDFAIEDDETLTPLGGKVELLFAPNKGEGFRPLAKIASGGELSRIALAFSNIINNDAIHTIVFDEIDVGISGQVAIKVAEQIRDLSKKKQVLCITHMPQTVAIADYHFHLHKEERNSRTYTFLEVLDEDKHIEHMAQMIAGSHVSESALQTARDLKSKFK